MPRCSRPLPEPVPTGPPAGAILERLERTDALDSPLPTAKPIWPLSCLSPSDAPFQDGSCADLVGSRCSRHFARNRRWSQAGEVVAKATCKKRPFPARSEASRIGPIQNSQTCRFVRLTFGDTPASIPYRAPYTTLPWTNADAWSPPMLHIVREDDNDGAAEAVARIESLDA